MTGDEYKGATSDEQLVLQMAAGDEQALIELHRRYAPHLTALARHMLSTPAEADAGVQMAFVKAWERAAEFNPHKLRAKTWLLMLSHRLFRTSVPAQPAPRVAKVAELFLEADHTNEAEQKNPNVPGPNVTAPRDLLSYAFFQGYTDQALAELTGQPLEAVKRELRTALEQLGHAARRKP